MEWQALYFTLPQWQRSYFFMTGHKTPAGIVLAVMFGIPLLLILFKEPLTRKIQKRADKMEEGRQCSLYRDFSRFSKPC